LQGGEVLSEDDEAGVALAADVVDAGADEDLLAFEGVIDAADGSPLAVGLEAGADEGVISVLVCLVVDDFDGVVALHGAKKNIC
jgi:hypothetical protein